MNDLTPIEQIAALIRRVDTTEGMNEVVELIKVQRARIARISAHRFSPGDAVEFDSKKAGLVRGTVLRLMKKNVLVEVEKKLSGGATYPIEWTVHPTLLRPAAKEAVR
jgi:hypothetical protein